MRIVILGAGSAGGWLGTALNALVDCFDRVVNLTDLVPSIWSLPFQVDYQMGLQSGGEAAMSPLRFKVTLAPKNGHVLWVHASSHFFPG